MAHYQESRYLFLLSICMDELISAPNVFTFLPKQLSYDYEKNPRASNQVPHPE